MEYIIMFVNILLVSFGVCFVIACIGWVLIENDRNKLYLSKTERIVWLDISFKNISV